MYQTLANRVSYVAFKLGNRTDLTVPISGTGPGFISSAAINAAGQNYQQGDTVLVQQLGAYGGELVVTNVDVNGAVLGLFILNDGFGYTNGVGVSCIEGNGTGLTVNITATAVSGPSRIDLWLRDAYINLTMSNRFPGTEATLQFNTVQGVGIYDFPPSVRAIEALTLYRSDGTIITVETKDIAYLRRMNNVNQAAPSMWAEFGRTIQFRPIPDGNGPYTCVLDAWLEPQVEDPIETTPIVLPIDWLEALDYAATVRGHTELQEENKAREKQALLYGSVDPQTGKYTPGLIQDLQTRLVASRQFKDWGVQPKNATQPFTRRR